MGIALQKTACEPTPLSATRECGTGVGNHPECVSGPQIDPEIKLWGGRRPGAGRKRKPPITANRHPGPRWYVIQTVPRQELRAILFLAAADFATHMPIYVDRQHPIATPLFPGYLFVRFDVDCDDWRLICSDEIPGVLRLFRADEHTPLPLPEGLVEGWKTQAGLDGVIDATEPVVPIAAGARVRIADGPFASFSAIVQWSEGERLRVLAEIFGRATPVELRRNQVELGSD